MSDLNAFVEFAASVAAIVVPILVVVRLLAADGGSGITDLFMVPRPDDAGALPLEEEMPPRWQVERLTSRKRVTATSSRYVSPSGTIRFAVPRAGARPDLAEYVAALPPSGGPPLGPTTD